MTSFGIAWRTGVTALLLVDYFLFTTGNPSLTYSLLGGWFIVPLLIAAAIGISYGIAALGDMRQRRAFIVYLIIVSAVVTVLLLTSGAAHRRAESALVGCAYEFVRDPATTVVRAGSDTRALMRDIKNHPYTMHEDAYIPTFRRMDFKITSDSKGIYAMILTRSWSGIPSLALSRQPT